MVTVNFKYLISCTFTLIKWSEKEFYWEYRFFKKSVTISFVWGEFVTGALELRGWNHNAERDWCNPTCICNDFSRFRGDRLVSGD